MILKKSLTPVFTSKLTKKTLLKNLFWGGFFYIILFITFFIYKQGLTASFQFDDIVNLNGLKKIHDTDSFIQFTFDGKSGPLGRPVALFTFALQSHLWPNNPEFLLNWNILIHILNGSLVTWLTINLARASSPNQTRESETGIFTGATWMLLPILVSSSLFMIQRMTILSATFVFTGLSFYTITRLQTLSQPDKHLFKLSTIIIVFTTLAMFSKENGCLLPIYILAIEATFFSSQTFNCDSLIWKKWKLLFLFFPLACILCYITYRSFYLETTVLQQGYTATDRLSTQGFILWQYLFNAFIPRPSSLGPFQDTIISIHIGKQLLGWCLFLLAIAITIWASIHRKKYPLLSFAILWYFLGHIIESTTIPLEFYFEHRNYIPLLGPLFAIISYSFTLKKHYKLTILILSSYLLIISSITYMSTSLWGQKTLAAKIWVQDNPDSLRATTHFARQYEGIGDIKTALKQLHTFNTKHNYSIGAQIEELMFSCILNPDQDHGFFIKKILNNSQTARYEAWAVEMPEKFHAWLLKNQCKNINFHTINTLADHIIKNKRYHSHPVALHNLYVIKAIVNLQYGEHDTALNNLDTALTHHMGPDALAFATKVATIHNKPTLIKRWATMSKGQI